MFEEGQYRFTNGTAVADDLEKERMQAVVNHEFLHNTLYTKTVYGQMVLMLEKNSFIHTKSREYQEVLFMHMNRMQERVAVNIELMQECIDNGMNAYFDAKENLKLRNRTYYNHFRKLCCINGKIRSVEDAKELQKKLVWISTIALNINPELVPLEEFNDKKELNGYLMGNGPYISPNKRFDILVNELFRKNDKNKYYSSVIKGSINFEKMYDYDYIHEIAEKAISRILVNESNSQKLLKRISTIAVKKYEIFEGIENLTAKPAKINTNKEVLYKYVNIKEFLEVLDAQKEKEIFVMNQLGGFEEIYMACIYGHVGEKRVVYSFIISSEDIFFHILSNMQCQFIFYRTKIIAREGKTIRKMVSRLPIYIYEDCPIIASLQFIEDFFCGGRFSFIKTDNYLIFVITKRSITLFTNVLIGAKKALTNRLEKTAYYVENCDEICNSNEVLRLDRICNDYEPNKFEDAKLLE